MKGLILACVLLTASLAGCASDGKESTYTCGRTGQVLDLSTIPGSDADGFQPESACAPPTPPATGLKELPTNLMVYYPATLQWVVDSGNYSAGHSMATQIRWSHHPIDAATLSGPDKYGTMIAGFAHQEIEPKSAGGSTFSGKWVPPANGTYYIRSYAQVRGDGLVDTDFWGPETKVVVQPVKPTGVIKTITHKPGNVAGGLDATSITAALGDALIFKNADATEHTFTFVTAPKGFKQAPVKVAAGDSSPAILITIPGGYKAETDDLQKLSVQVSVAAPA